MAILVTPLIEETRRRFLTPAKEKGEAHASPHLHFTLEDVDYSAFGWHCVHFVGPVNDSSASSFSL